MDEKKQLKTAVELLKRTLVWAMQDISHHRKNMNSGTLFSDIHEFINNFDSNKSENTDLHERIKDFEERIRDLEDEILPNKYINERD